MRAGATDRDPDWIFDNLVEAKFRTMPDGMVEFQFRATPEHGARIESELAKVASELPREAETTDEQHLYDALVEICKRRIAEVALRDSVHRVDIASAPMKSIRDADQANDAVRRRSRRAGDPVDTKLRATTEMILAMPVDDRLRQLEAESSFFSSIRPIDG